MVSHQYADTCGTKIIKKYMKKSITVHSIYVDILEDEKNIRFNILTVKLSFLTKLALHNEHKYLNTPFTTVREPLGAMGRGDDLVCCAVFSFLDVLNLLTLVSTNRPGCIRLLCE